MNIFKTWNFFLLLQPFIVHHAFMMKIKNGGKGKELYYLKDVYDGDNSKIRE